jgi:hypothetical protein
MQQRPGSGGGGDHLRAQVVRFEQELASRIEDLSQQQRQLDSVHDLRRRWVNNAAAIDSLHAQLCLSKLEAYRTKMETMRLRFAVDELQLTNMQEACRIQELLQATSPKQDGEAVEPTCTEDDVLTALQAAIQSRQAQMEEYQDLLRESTAVLLGDRRTRDRMIEQLESAFVTQQARLQEQFDVATSKLKQTTEEYLVLRHNARVTQEMLAKSQQQSMQTCEAMHRHLEQLKKSAREQLLALQHSSQKDFEKVVSVHREQVVKMEHECAALERDYQRLLRDYRRKVAAIKAEMHECQQKYDALQMQRRHEIRAFNAELSALRKHVQRAEAVALDKATAREFGDMNIPPAHRRVWHEVAGPALRAASRSAAIASRKAKAQAQGAAPSTVGSDFTKSTTSSWAWSRQHSAAGVSHPTLQRPSTRVGPSFRTNNAFRSRMAARQRREEEQAEADEEEEEQEVSYEQPQRQHRAGKAAMSPIAEEQGEESEGDYSQTPPSHDADEAEFGEHYDEEAEEQGREGEETQKTNERTGDDDPNLGRIIAEQPPRISLQTYESVTREIQAIREKMDLLLRQSEAQDFQR